MNEVEKLYKNAGVRYLIYVADTFPPVEHPQIDFNEKKQLELIKWLIYSGKYKKDFGESLASVINNQLWQELTDAERTQIKEILE